MFQLNSCFFCNIPDPPTGGYVVFPGGTKFLCSKCFAAYNKENRAPSEAPSAPPPVPQERSALDHQVGGDHYRQGSIQPVEYIQANDLRFLEGCVVKRVTRYNKPTGKGRLDLEKAIHELQLLIETTYSPRKERSGGDV